MKEQQRLLTMLHEHKITKEEFTILCQALEKKHSKFLRFFNLMINPFETIVGWRAAILGIIIILLTSFFGYLLRLYSIGLVEYPPAVLIKNSMFHYSFWLVLYQNIMISAVLSILALVFAKLFKAKKIRVIDFFVTILIARFPAIILLLLLFILQTLQSTHLANEFANGALFKPSIASSILNVVNMICLCWLLATYYFALKASSGLNTKKLFITAFGTLIIAAPITGYLTMWFA